MVSQNEYNKEEERLFTNREILVYLERINEHLKSRQLSGEISLFGGAAMCLVYGSRSSTKDIDALYAPTPEMYQIIDAVAKEYGLPSDWLNNGVKGFVSGNHDVRMYRRLSHLTITAASPEYLFAMKCLASRLGTSRDVEDIQFLIRQLNIRSVTEAFKILERFYPPRQILPKTQYLLETLLKP
ncbi:hypothetical protein H7C18_17975 [Cohnella sp. CBP 2801]|uniref:DUF6036 domain-containing protein n=1 Tax=Cohnella zeiphila TaxID=2761120 RepID=A0A7X0VWS3_9BACL|nr:hypothetical protein [Cohnella zeiphila]